MTIPKMLTCNESMKILTEYGREAGWIRHCVAVAEAATRVGDVLAKRRAIDSSFLWPAGRLHDIGRYITHDQKLILRHESGSSAAPDVDGALLAIWEVGKLVGVHRGRDSVMKF